MNNEYKADDVIQITDPRLAPDLERRKEGIRTAEMVKEIYGEYPALITWAINYDDDTKQTEDVSALGIYKKVSTPTKQLEKK